jgi:maleylpyruvate isomerase
MTQGRPQRVLDWMRDGTVRLAAVVAGLPDADLDAATLLPGWNRRYLLSHVAANADALRNLVYWARTGIERRMYASREARAAGIAAGAARPAGELRAWIGESAEALAADLAALPAQAWDAEVITGQGVTRQAREIPWLRAREVYVHAVDLGTGTGFGDLPEDFLTALLDDVAARRSKAVPGPALTLTAVTGTGTAVGTGTGTGRVWQVAGAGEPVSVTGPLAGLAAWLSGRPADDLTAADGTGVPNLPAWL